MRVVEIPPLAPRVAPPARLRSATLPPVRKQQPHHRLPTPPRQTVTITREVIVVIPEVVVLDVVPAATPVPASPTRERRRPWRVTLAIAVTAAIAAIAMFVKTEPDVSVEHHEPTRIERPAVVQPRVEPRPRVESRVTETAPTHESELRPTSQKLERVRARRRAKPKNLGPSWDPDALFPPE